MLNTEVIINEAQEVGRMLDCVTNFCELLIKKTNAAWEKLKAEGFELTDLEIIKPTLPNDPPLCYRIVVIHKASGKVLYQENFIGGTHEEIQRFKETSRC